MSKGNSDAVQQQYQEMVNSFKKHCQDSLKGESDAWNNLLQQGLSSSEHEICVNYKSGLE